MHRLVCSNLGEQLKEPCKESCDSCTIPKTIEWEDITDMCKKICEELRDISEEVQQQSQLRKQ